MTAGQTFYSPLKLEVCRIRMTLYSHVGPPVREDTPWLLAPLHGSGRERRGLSNLLYLPVVVL